MGWARSDGQRAAALRAVVSPGPRGEQGSVSRATSEMAAGLRTVRGGGSGSGSSGGRRGGMGWIAREGEESLGAWELELWQRNRRVGADALLRERGSGPGLPAAPPPLAASRRGCPPTPDPLPDDAHRAARAGSDGHVWRRGLLAASPARPRGHGAGASDARCAMTPAGWASKESASASANASTGSSDKSRSSTVLSGMYLPIGGPRCDHDIGGGREEPEARSSAGNGGLGSGHWPTSQASHRTRPAAKARQRPCSFRGAQTEEYGTTTPKPIPRDMATVICMLCMR